MPTISPIIAIVDDEEAVRASLASLVRSLGYDVRTYGSASEFLADSLDPDCMFLDVQMPIMTGEELQARLVALDRQFPIIFMTAFPTEAVRKRVTDAGAFCYLNKPAAGDDIIGCLQAALASHMTG